MTEKYNTYRIQIRAYSKCELAHIYFPDSEQQVAVNRLMMWVKQAPDLMEQLKAAGYQSRCKILTPRQVRLIVEAFGEPD